MPMSFEQHPSPKDLHIVCDALGLPNDLLTLHISPELWKAATSTAHKEITFYMKNAPITTPLLQAGSCVFVARYVLHVLQLYRNRADLQIDIARRFGFTGDEEALQFCLGSIGIAATSYQGDRD